MQRNQCRYLLHHLQLHCYTPLISPPTSYAKGTYISADILSDQKSSSEQKPLLSIGAHLQDIHSEALKQSAFTS